MKKTLVTYFSAGGVTKAVAKRLANAIDADLYAIEPITAYTDADLDWRDPISRSSLEMKDSASRPQIKSRCENMADYDIVLVGFPIWWYTAPMIIRTFLESYDFTGKTVILYATSGGSPMGNTLSDLTSCCSGAVMKEGCVFAPDADEVSLRSWFDSVK